MPRSLSLLEVLVAVGLLGTLVLSYASTLTLSSCLDSLSRERSAAVEQARSVLDELLLEPSAARAARDGEDFVVPLGAGTLPGAGGGAAGRIEVSEPHAGLQRVRVAVLWRSRTSEEQRLELVTWVGSQ